MIPYLKINRSVRQLLLAFSCILFFTLQSCEKGDKDSGMDILPGDKNLEVKYFDGITTNAYSLRADSIDTENINYASIGRYSNTFFGQSEASFASHFDIPAIDTWKDTAGKDMVVVDSVFLVLSPKYFFPDTPNLTFEVFPLTRELKKAKTFPSFDISNHFTPGSSVSQSNPVSLKDGIYKIPLSIEFGTKLLYAKAINNGSDYFFPGLYIRSSESTPDNGLAIFDLKSDDFRLTVHFRRSKYDSTTLVLDTTNAVFSPTNEENLALITHQYPDNIKLIEPGDPVSIFNQDIYIQGLAGIKTRLVFAGLLDWMKQGNYTINKAEVVLPIKEYNSSDVLLYPERILFLPLLESTRLIDKYYLGNLSDSSYSTLITSYVSTLNVYKNDTSLNLEDKGFDIYDSGAESLELFKNYLYPSQVVISNSAERPIRLKITYTNH